MSTRIRYGSRCRNPTWIFDQGQRCEGVLPLSTHAPFPMSTSSRPGRGEGRVIKVRKPEHVPHLVRRDSERAVLRVAVLSLKLGRHERRVERLSVDGRLHVVDVCGPDVIRVSPCPLLATSIPGRNRREKL